MFVSIFDKLLMFIILYCFQFYLPKHNQIGKVLKVECTPFVGKTEYPSIFAISSRVKPGRLALFIIDEQLNFFEILNLKGILLNIIFVNR